MTNEYIEKLKKVVKGDTVVYIDAANLELSTKSMWVNPKDMQMRRTLHQMVQGPAVDR